jgi:ABC-type transport system substrate-binding protein/class 3 adenylate cyclase/tRNA A-37 threonylcarbamoyl transferase component Bud32/sugar lactone lactonase YvrE
VGDLAAGTALSGYRIERLIGHGSSGSVYAAVDLSLERRVALKVLLPELAADERFRERFLRESRVAASLEHEHVIPIYAAGEGDGHVYIAMRLVEGSDLRALIDADGALDVTRAVAIVVQVSEALDAAHRRGLVHRDVKPANILVDETDTAYLCDFGLARHATTVSSVTRDTAFAGTIEYISPEQIHGEDVDGRADVYSLGCVLYESLAGRSPFQRSTEVATVLAHLGDEPPSLVDANPAVPAQLDAVVTRALAKSPDDRYESAGAFAEAARAAAGGATPTGRRTPQLRTFLIADVRGYTRYTHDHGDEAGAELASAFARVTRDVVGRREGRLIELRGDEALVVFESARQALRAALEIQQEIGESNLPRGVGIGLDAGEAVPVGKGFRGAALNMAARLCSRAAAGEVLASEGVVHLAGAVDGVAYGLRRLERVKGVDRPVVAFEVEQAGRDRGRQLRRRLSSRARATSTRTRVAAAGAVAALVAALVGALVLAGGSEGALPAGAFAVLAGNSGKSEGVVRMQSDVFALITDDRNGDLWGLTGGGRVLQQIDARTRKPGTQFALPISPYTFAPTVAFGSIWATDPDNPHLLRIDPRYGRVSATINLPPGEQADGPQNAQGLAVTDSGVWVAYGYPKRIAQYDPRSGRVRSYALGNQDGAFYDALVAAAGDVVWVIDRQGRKLLRVDPRDGTIVARGRLHAGWVEDARVVDGILWVAMQGDGGVWQVDRSGNTLGKTPTGDLPYSLADAPGTGQLWVANANAGTVTRIDTDSGEAKTFRTGHRPLAVGVSNNRAWVFLGLGAADARALVGGSNVVRQAAVANPYFSTDPSTFGGIGPLILSYAVGARLMDYRPGADGSARIVPDVAAAAPTSADGKTWTFRIRKGFRFSPPSGQAVTADTFRFSIERALSPKLSNSYCRVSLLSDLVGEQAYVDGKTDHISGLRAHGDELVLQLVAPSWTLPARVAMPCFSAVPVGTPVAPDGLDEPIPSAGPYYVAYNLGDFELVLKKNPNYGGTRAQRVDGVVVTENLSAKEAGDRVVRGEADYAYDDTQPAAPIFAPGGTYDRRFAHTGAGKPQYARVASNVNRFLFFNTTRGPLRDVRLRRAIALAVDRRAFADLFLAAPRGLFLPPGIPGYAKGDVYAAKPQLVRARALVGKRHVRVLVTGDAANPAMQAATSELRKDLARIGIDVVVRLVPDPWSLAKGSEPRVDILFDGWAADYPDGWQYFTAILDPRDGPRFYPPFFTDPRWLGKIRDAARLKGDARARAYRRLDLDLARGPVPVTAVAVADSPPQLFSARVTCKTFLPMFFSLADPTSLCVK